MCYKKIIIFILFTGIFNEDIFCAGKSVLENLVLGVNARPSGMGEAFTSVFSDLDGVFFNPATSGNLDERILSLSHFRSFADQSYTSVFLGYPPKSMKKNNFTGYAGILYFDGGSFTANYVDGTSRILKAQQDYILSAGITSTEKSKRAVYGFSMKVISSELVEQYRSQTVVADIGAIWKIKNYINAGLCYQNIGFPLKYGGAEEKLPELLKAGVSYNYRNITLACDVNHRFGIKEIPDKINLGFEYIYELFPKGEFYRAFSIRCGYKLNYEKENFTSGFGVTWNEKGDGFDYSISDIDGILFHRLTLNFVLKGRE